MGQENVEITHMFVPAGCYEKVQKPMYHYCDPLIKYSQQDIKICFFGSFRMTCLLLLIRYSKKLYRIILRSSFSNEIVHSIKMSYFVAVLFRKNTGTDKST